MPSDITSKVDTFFNQFRVRKFSEGQILILHGDKTDYVYYLLKGKVKQYDVTYRGDEIILNVFKPGAFFPMSSAISKEPNLYTFEAEVDIEVRQAPAQEVIAFIQANPDVMFDLLSRVFRGAEGIIGRMAHLMSSSAKSRLLYELILEARRFGSDQSDGTCHLNINEKDLSARAGLSRETVSREMHKLKEATLLTISSKGIVINDITALETKLGQAI